jgi:hypothetical protein
VEGGSMTRQQAHNVVALLQKEPMAYRNFGVWWWHVKSELKRHGFGKDQLHHLGPFDDASVHHYYDGLTTVQRDNEAYEYQYVHAFHKYGVNVSAAPDGETYLIHDQDAE